MIKGRVAQIIVEVTDLNNEVKKIVLDEKNASALKYLLQKYFPEYDYSGIPGDVVGFSGRSNSVEVKG